jgi:aspartate aminotransferase-like enzyme
VAAAVADHPRAAALCFAACESSTGVQADVAAVAAAARAAGREDLLVLVDAITAVGAAPLEADGWDLDVVIGGSQKAFMIPPGLAFLSLSPRAQRRLAVTGGGGLYFNLARELAAQQGSSTAWTPATALVYALDAALAAIPATGVEEVWAATERRARMTRAAVAALGLGL